MLTPARLPPSHSYIYLSDDDYHSVLPGGATMGASVRAEVTVTPAVSGTAPAVHSKAQWPPPLSCQHHTPAVKIGPCSAARCNLHIFQQGEKRWVVTDIIGAEDGLGVENLSGSGAIASTYWCV